VEIRTEAAQFPEKKYIKRISLQCDDSGLGKGNILDHSDFERKVYSQLGGVLGLFYSVQVMNVGVIAESSVMKLQ
jgi:hypothetical protein